MASMNTTAVRRSTNPLMRWALRGCERPAMPGTLHELARYIKPRHGRFRGTKRPLRCARSKKVGDEMRAAGLLALSLAVTACGGDGGSGSGSNGDAGGGGGGGAGAA